MPSSYTSQSDGYIEPNRPNAEPSRQHKKKPSQRKPPERRETTVEMLTRADNGHRVRFARPGNGASSGPVISGVLIGIETELYWRGNMKRQGIALHIGHPDRFGGFNHETYGPLTANHPIQVLGIWRRRVEPEYEPEPPFNTSIKRIRVLFLGGPFDGIREEIPVDEFPSSRNLTRADPDFPETVVHTYLHFGELVQIKGALYGGKWRLGTTTDLQKPYPEGVKVYNWGAE
jgi:hypothetical protein